MKKFIALRNHLFQLFYGRVLKKIFFRFDPEHVHESVTKIGTLLGSHPIGRSFVSGLFAAPAVPLLSQTIAGIHFKNPIGLSAGFDKNGMLTNILPSIGFGFAEIGSVTAKPCQGNKKPRLWRLPKSQALVVYYGLKNDGAAIISQRLAKKSFRIPIGMSIAKTYSQETSDCENGIQDYLESLRAFEHIGQYVTLNISCPNVHGGQTFQDPNNLDKLLTAVDGNSISKPIFLKISPDIADETIDGIVRCGQNHRVAGFVISNLTKNRSEFHLKDPFIPSVGGISGKPVASSSNALLKTMFQKTDGRMILIGVGGVFSPQDAYTKIRLGASLVQLITGMIFQGPQLISSIVLGLEKLLRADGFTEIGQAIGIDAMRSSESVGQKAYSN